MMNGSGLMHGSSNKQYVAWLRALLAREQSNNRRDSNGVKV